MSPLLSVGALIILRETMQSTDTMYGVGLGLVSSAAVLGALTIGLFTKRLRMNTLYRRLIAIALLLLPLMQLDIFVISKVQKKTPNENLGKVMAIIIAVSQCAAPIGQTIYGVAFEAFHASVYLPTFFTSAVLLVVAGVTQ